MKKIIILIILCVTPLFSLTEHMEKFNPFINNTHVMFYYMGEKIGQCTKDEFIDMTKDSIVYNYIKQAEEAGTYRVVIIEPELLDPVIKIEWLVDGVVVKTLQARIKFNSNSPIYSRWREMYRNITEIAFPLSIGFIILLILL